jgi:hypothetical protein
MFRQTLHRVHEQKMLSIGQFFFEGLMSRDQLYTSMSGSRFEGIRSEIGD